MGKPESQKRKRFSEIFSEYYELIFCAVYSKISNEHDTGDITQEVFIRLYERLDSVENARRWLFTALKLVVKEFYRKKYHDDFNIDDVFDNVAMSYVNGFRDTRIIIKEAIENMENFKDERERTIFELIAINNLPYNIVAKQFGMTRRQVEYKYTRLVNRIMAYLNGKGINNIEDLL